MLIVMLVMRVGEDDYEVGDVNVDDAGNDSAVQPAAEGAAL